MTVQTKVCLRCSGALPNQRRRFCCESCRYWYNSIKRERESHLAPTKKRNNRFFSMVTGSTVVSGPGAKGQGRRSGGTVKGSMSARVLCTVEQWVPVTRENLDRHFAGIPGYFPESVRMGDDSRLTQVAAYIHLSTITPEL